jgi:hypothetical protein
MKIWWDLIKMMLIGYPYSKHTQNLKFVDFEIFDKYKSIEQN